MRGILLFALPRLNAVTRINSGSGAEVAMSPKCSPKILMESILEMKFRFYMPPIQNSQKQVLCKVRNLSKTYLMGEVSVHALRKVDLDLYQGELMVLLGPSGSGKSTLLNIMGGLDVPSEGEMWFENFDLTIADEEARTEYRRQEVGFIFQFYNLIPSLTALENVRLSAEIAAQPMAADDALLRVGLAERMHHFPSQLSGGEQQRVAVARAIVKQPRLLLCDEPTGALDHSTGQLVLLALQKINQELGTTTVIITHNADIGKMADRVIHLSDGQISRIETPAEKVSPDKLLW